MWKSFSGAVAEIRQRDGIQHACFFRGQRSENEFGFHSADAKPRANQHRIFLWVVQLRAPIIRIVCRAHDDAFQSFGVNRRRFFWRRDRHKTCADALRRARRQPRRTGHHWPAINQRMSAIVFMPVASRNGKRREPKIGGTCLGHFIHRRYPRNVFWQRRRPEPCFRYFSKANAFF